MAKLQDILTVEQDRPDSQSVRVVHLFLEGSFLRAYEWSAWLCCRYLNEFKATRRQIKNTVQDFVFIGFSQNQQPATLTTVMHTILEFPLERKTPFDCMVFVADLKQQISKMI